MTVATERRTRGQVSFHAGLAAEEFVSRAYLDRGYALVKKRWRGQAGEIDLIFRRNGGLVFTEVKKSRSLDQAALRITARQIARISAAAMEFAAHEPQGLLTEMRFDAALVDGNGALRVLPNAFAPG
ncbi:YraN family protein [Roseobacter sp. S98]|uniref:YraN family protein n=1 Tax=Roseobacter algicola (ex Choi et al. 2025) (nom. illeg.) TaxID=3092138 RepID=UPI0035C6BCE2